MTFNIKQVPVDQCPWYIDHLLTQALSDLRAKLPHLAYVNLREALKVANRCKDMKRAGKIMFAMQCVKKV